MILFYLLMLCDIVTIRELFVQRTQLQFCVIELILCIGYSYLCLFLLFILNLLYAMYCSTLISIYHLCNIRETGSLTLKSYIIKISFRPGSSPPFHFLWGQFTNFDRSTDGCRFPSYVSVTKKIHIFWIIFFLIMRTSRVLHTVGQLPPSWIKPRPVTFGQLFNK